MSFDKNTKFWEILNDKKINMQQFVYKTIAEALQLQDGQVIDVIGVLSQITNL